MRGGPEIPQRRARSPFGCSAAPLLGERRRRCYACRVGAARSAGRRRAAPPPSRAPPPPSPSPSSRSTRRSTRRPTARCSRRSAARTASSSAWRRRPHLEAQRAQCWALLRLVQRLAAAGARRPPLLLCAAEAAHASRAGASTGVAYRCEFPELSVQRLHLPAAADLLRQSGPLGAAPRRPPGLALVALRRRLGPRPRGRRLARPRGAARRACASAVCQQPRAKPSSTPTVDAAGTYLITGGSGGLGSPCLVAPPGAERAKPHQIVLLSRRAATTARRRRPLRRRRPRPPGERHVGGARRRHRRARDLPPGGRPRRRFDREHDRRSAGEGRRAEGAGLLALLAYCARRRLAPQWVLAASSTSSLLGYAGQSNYCAANGLLDSAATLARPPPPTPARRRRRACWPSTLGRGARSAWRARRTKAHQISLASGEIPMASVAAISCIAQALRTLADEPPPAPPADRRRLGGGGGGAAARPRPPVCGGRD